MTRPASCGARPRQPIRLEESTYLARHGAGYSRFEHVHDGIGLDLVQFVPLDEPVKVSLLTIENRSGRARRLSVTAYAEWVLGTSRGDSGPRIVTSLEPETGALLVRNPWNTEFAGADRLPRPRRPTDGVDGRSDRVPRPQRRPGSTLWPGPGSPAPGSRGRGHGPVHRPADQLRARRRSKDPGPGPARRGGRRCRPGRTHPTRGATADHAAVLREVARYWDEVEGTVQVRTPDRSMDIMLNRWLALPDAGVPALGEDRVLPGRGRLRVPRPAPGRHRPADRRGVSSPGNTSCGRRRTSSPRATSSTGGIRLRVAASVRGSPTTASGCHTRSIATSRSRATRRSSTRRSPISKGPRSDRARPTPTSARTARRESASLFDHCAAAIDVSLEARRPWAAAHRVRRLERRDEPGGSRGPGRERLAGLVPARRPGRLRAHRRGARRTCSR